MIGGTTVHQYIYEAAKRERIPRGMRMSFICEDRNCLNPDHIELRPFMREVPKSGATNRAKMECPKGHPYTGENLYVRPNGHRVCRECHRENLRRYFAKLRAAEKANARAV
jgi:hypothetical protein